MANDLQLANKMDNFKQNCVLCAVLLLNLPGTICTKFAVVSLFTSEIILVRIKNC